MFPQAGLSQEGQTEARALLDRLEKAHAEISGFSSPLTYRKEYALEGDFETRIGTVALRGSGVDREVILTFDRIIDASGHGTDESGFHLYEGGWWTEVDPRRKRVVLRQVVEPGAQRDPFEIGEGPLPLPFGQKSVNVLERFDVSVVEVPDEPLFKGINDAHVLRLTPKPHTKIAEDHESLDLLFETNTLLPLGILVVHRSGDRTTAWLRSPKADTNEEAFTGRAAEAKKLLEAASTDPNWTVDRKPLPSKAIISEDGS